MHLPRLALLVGGLAGLAAASRVVETRLEAARSTVAVAGRWSGGGWWR